ncbi:MAG: DegT/DnrJ/EryC1/StrS family aminotransferase [Acidimicrobiales bacterium]
MPRPAILGGPATFPERLPIARPFTPALETMVERLRPSWEAGMLTNSTLVAEFESAAAQRLGSRHAVAVSSCTAGLMLSLRALLAPSGPAPALGTRTPVVLPSFTFSASGHAVAWNNARPRFVECDPATFQVDPADAARQAEGAGAIMATHVFGAPCRAEQLEKVAADAGAALVFDAAHAFGAVRQGRPTGGFGDASVYSLSPTKVVVAGEGGVVATDRDDVAEAVRLGRDYANPGDYDTRFVGLNARMSELHAAVALSSLDVLDDHLARRRSLAALYTRGLATIGGLSPQVVEAGDLSTYKDFTIDVDPVAFGMDRDSLVAALTAEGIQTRCYFSPPVHRQQAYAGLGGPPLPVTDRAASRVVSLPMFGSLAPESVEDVIGVLDRLHENAPAVVAVLGK